VVTQCVGRRLSDMRLQSGRRAHTSRHLVGVHGGIPHVQGEKVFVCINHSGVAPMNHLEFLKHAQEVASTAMYGRAPPPKCQPAPISQGQVVSMPLKEWQSIASGKTHSGEKCLKLRWGFSIASSGAVLMIINGARFIPLSDFELSVCGWVQMLAGFAILGGAALFYSNQSRYIQGSAVVLVAASAAWAVLSANCHAGPFWHRLYLGRFGHFSSPCTFSFNDRRNMEPTLKKTKLTKPGIDGDFPSPSR